MLIRGRKGGTDRREKRKPNREEKFLILKGKVGTDRQAKKGTASKEN